MGIHDIIMEEDVIQIVNEIKAIGNNWNRFEHIVDDIKLVLWQL
jgi:hypothetical protein